MSPLTLSHTVIVCPSKTGRSAAITPITTQQLMRNISSQTPLSTNLNSQFLRDYVMEELFVFTNVDGGREREREREGAESERESPLLWLQLVLCN